MSQDGKPRVFYNARSLTYYNVFARHLYRWNRHKGHW